MNLLLQHWSFDPVLVVLAAAACVHAVGLYRRLRSLRAAGRPSPLGREWRLRAASFYAGLLVMAVAICSPIDYWADHYLFAHMIQHILLAFFAPPLIVLGAPWLSLQRGLPRPVRVGFARLAQRLRRRAALRRTGNLLADPRTALLAFNVDMVIWHLPGPFDLAERNSSVHIWGEHGGFIVFGVLLWLHLLDSPPLRPRLTRPQRVAAALATNAVMVAIAVSLVLFSHRAYPVYAHVGPGLFGQTADQQIAGSALWICGEFTLAPTIYWNTMQFLREQAGWRRPRRVPPWTRRARTWATVSPAQAEMGWRDQSSLLKVLPMFAARRAGPAAAGTTPASRDGPGPAG